MSRRILIIERPQRNALRCENALQNDEYAISTVHSAKQALQKRQLAEYDLYILNALSLRTSGLRICHNLRKRVPATPRILLTASQYLARVKDAANAVLAPPFTTRKLRNRVHNLLPPEVGTVERNWTHPVLSFPSVGSLSGTRYQTHQSRRPVAHGIPGQSEYPAFACVPDETRLGD